MSTGILKIKVTGSTDPYDDEWERKQKESEDTLDGFIKEDNGTE